MPILQFLMATKGAAIYVADSDYVVRGWNNLEARVRNASSHQDLWVQLQQLEAQRPLQILKVESHLDLLPARAAAMPTWMIAGHLQADAMAEAVAHTNLLWATGQLTRTADADGVLRFRTV